MRQEESTSAEDLGRAIRVLRTVRDLSRPVLAEEAGVSYSYLSEIETGAKLPSTRVLAAIAEALGVSVDELESTARELASSEEPAATSSETGPRVRESSLPYTLTRRSLKTVQGLDEATEFLAMAPVAGSARLTVPLPRRKPGLGPEVPEALVSEIHAGNCIAFLGAGFSAAAGTPTWDDLLRIVAKTGGLSGTLHREILARLNRKTASSLDEAAQVLEDELGREQFLQLLRTRLAEPRMTEAMLARLRLLHGIPFRSILTTNFDGILHGVTPSHDAYREALRPESVGWWEPRYWSGEGAFTLKLHGDIAAPRDTIVLTRRDYRRRLYEDPAYETFLRAIMATTTVLYMGFSFEDAYLNELRSEILAMLGHERESRPVAYAIVNDVPESTVRHYRAHEGIEILSYETQEKKGTERDFSGFDDYLAEIHEHTNPLLRFGRYLERKRILWVDPHPQNNALAFAHLSQAAKLSGREKSALVTVDTAEQGLAVLQKSDRRNPFDLAITHWGADTGRKPAAIRLLEGIRRDDLRCPVIVFASAEDVDARKLEVLGLGAQAYCSGFENLFRTMERVLAPGWESL